MDMTYTVSATRFFLDGTNPETIEYAETRPLKNDSRVDDAMDVRMELKTDRGVVQSGIHTDMDQPFLGHVIPKVWELPSIQIELDHATIYYYK